MFVLSGSKLIHYCLAPWFDMKLDCHTLVSGASSAPTGPAKKSRPAWDLKGRLEDMEKELKSLSSKKREQEELKQRGEQHIEVRDVSKATRVATEMILKDHNKSVYLSSEPCT